MKLFLKYTRVCVFVLKKITLYKDRKMSTLFYICLCSSYNWYKKVFFTVMNPEIIIILLHISSQICPKTIQLIHSFSFVHFLVFIHSMLSHFFSKWL